VVLPKEKVILSTKSKWFSPKKKVKNDVLMKNEKVIFWVILHFFQKVVFPSILLYYIIRKKSKKNRQTIFLQNTGLASNV
jgi:hypothetical protein